MNAIPPAAPSRWAALEDCGDCFENVLALLQPADVAACRLVSRAWRREVSSLLQALQPAAGTAVPDVADTFPHLARLQLTSGTSSTPSATADPSSMPPLRSLRSLRRLRRLRLQGQVVSVAGGALDCRDLLPLAGAPAFEELEACCLELRHADALQALDQLTALHLQGFSLGDWPGSLPDLLAPLRRLRHLHFACFQAAPGGSGSAAAVAAPQRADSEAGNPYGSAGRLAGLGRLTSLTSLELSCPDGASDAACWAVASGPLPRLQRLAIHSCASFGHAAPTVGDAGLELVCRALGGQLTSLALTGHTRVSDAGVYRLADLRLLQHLDLRVAAPAGTWNWQPLVTDDGLQVVGALTRLQSLHLGGACGLGQRSCAAITRHLHGLTALRLSDCAALGDAALFKLAPLAPQLHQLGLSGCNGVTDIALAQVLRGAAGLASLDLAGCHRNITGLGLRALGGLRRLHHLNLAGCDAITDAEIEALLPAVRSLECLDLSDCRVSDAACELLAAHGQRLQWLSLEHCADVSNRGLLHLASGSLHHLSELRLCGSGVSEGAVAQLRRTPRGRRLRVGLHKLCWWMAPDAAGLAL